MQLIVLLSQGGRRSDSRVLGRIGGLLSNLLRFGSICHDLVDRLAGSVVEAVHVAQGRSLVAVCIDRRRRLVSRGADGDAVGISSYFRPLLDFFLSDLEDEVVM